MDGNNITGTILIYTTEMYFELYIFLRYSFNCAL